MQISKSDSISKSLRTTSVSVGDSRKGKTHFIGTMCDRLRVFVLDLENGLQTIKHKKFDFVTANTWEEAKEVLEWYMLEGHANYDMFALDSITRLQAYLKEHLIAKPDQHGKNAGMMTMGKYDELAIQMRKVIDIMTKKCPTSFHCNAMASESKDELTGTVKIFPNLQGGFKFDLVGYFDTILYHQMGQDANGETQYWCEIAGTERNCAGTRLQDLRMKYGKVMPNDYNLILDVLEN